MADDTLIKKQFNALLIHLRQDQVLRNNAPRQSPISFYRRQLLQWGITESSKCKMNKLLFSMIYQLNKQGQSTNRQQIYQLHLLILEQVSIRISQCSSFYGGLLPKEANAIVDQFCYLGMRVTFDDNGGFSTWVKKCANIKKIGNSNEARYPEKTREVIAFFNIKNYKTDYFKRQRPKQMMGHWKKICEQITTQNRSEIERGPFKKYLTLLNGLNDVLNILFAHQAGDAKCLSRLALAVDYPQTIKLLTDF
jgi:hypothetical protein